jgi:C-terminal processing protease CtpA/Prc
LTYEKSNWTIEPQKEQITCKKVFLTNAHAQSQAETFMGIVEHYKLGEIIGQPTAGCNGNVMGFPLLGAYYFGFTGMKVLKHSGSQHHLIGIKPTIPITYTEKAILEGRDLELEKAIELLK